MMDKETLIEMAERLIVMIHDRDLPHVFEASGVAYDLYHDVAPIENIGGRLVRLIEKVSDELEWRNRCTEAARSLPDDGDWWKG